MKKILLSVLLLNLYNYPIQASYPLALEPITKAPLATRVKLKMINKGLKIAQLLKCNPYYIFSGDDPFEKYLYFEERCQILFKPKPSLHLAFGTLTSYLIMKKYSNKKKSLLYGLLVTFGSVLTLKITKKISNFLGKYITRKIASSIKPNDIKFVPEKKIAQYKANNNSFIKKITKYNSCIKKIISNKIAIYYLGKTNKNTQSKQHLKLHYNFVDQPTAQDLFNKKELRNMIHKIHKKEEEEQNKDRYTFVHAQKWHWHFTADLFKKLWELQYNEIINDYHFLRFEAKNSKNKNSENQKRVNALNGNDNIIDYNWNTPTRAHRLFMNHSIFGNANRTGGSSLYYFRSNFDYSNKTFSTKKLFKVLNFSQYYKQYKVKLKKLKKLHEESSKYGNMLLLSFDKKQLKKSVIATDFHGNRITRTVNNTQTYNTKTILDALRNDPEQVENCDEIIYCAILTQDLVLDPKNGPRIFSFNVTDKKKFKAYEQLRDEIFTELAQDMANPSFIQNKKSFDNDNKEIVELLPI
ncbi:hypothetical protein KAH94_03515 [bacterium]|nr:hypothetical protein [bacterium]